jgi:hypothetical protein
MQNWSDNMQTHLPGYRDRVLHVCLKPDEGGMNLSMPEEPSSEYAVLLFGYRKDAPFFILSSTTFGYSSRRGNPGGKARDRNAADL